MLQIVTRLRLLARGGIQQALTTEGSMRIDYIPVIVNFSMTAAYLFQRPFQPGKFVYWVGASVLTVGLALMRG